MKQLNFHLHALSALHVGTGQGIGTVDLPIARARATNLPLVPGSSLKGVMRDCLSIDADLKKTLFGPDNTIDVAHAGALAVGDAHLLLLPVRSFAGTLAYATCPFILRQYARDTMTTGHPIMAVSDTEAGITSISKLRIEDQVVLEDMDLRIKVDQNVNDWAQLIADRLFEDDTWKMHLKQRFVILSDSMFSFLADTATEIRMRIRIDPATRTVKQGALWSEENLPAESVLWGVIGVSPSRRKEDAQDAQTLAKTLLDVKADVLQLGGKHTVGRGLCRFVLNQKEA